MVLNIELQVEEENMKNGSSGFIVIPDYYFQVVKIIKVKVFILDTIRGIIKPSQP